MEEAKGADRKKSKCRFPIARIKKIMQFDEEVGKVSSSAPIVISHAIELFLVDLLKSLMEEAKQKGAKKIVLPHLESCVLSSQRLEFLKDFFPEKKRVQ